MVEKFGAGFIKPEIDAKREEWEVIRDCILGEARIKERRGEYLPYAGDKNCDASDLAAYEAYLKRAQFINAVRRTVNDLLGQVFIKAPLVTLNDNIFMRAFADNADGKGISLLQCAKKTLKHCIAYNYCGIYLDVPELKNSLSVKDFNEFAYRPMLVPISPFKIRNFRIERVGNVDKLTLVVLLEDYWTLGSDGFEEEKKQRLIVLRLVDGVFHKEIHEAVSKGGNEEAVGAWEKVSTLIPTDSAGNPLNTIPFFFIGSENNNPYPDEPLMYDLASINISHYRNSADYEQTMFVAGQPTLILSGLNNANLSNDLADLKLGVNHAILLKNGGTASLVQARAESGLAEAMEKKEKYMHSYGAKFFEEQTVVKTAYQIKTENSSQKTVLANCADNVSAAYTAALQYLHDICGFKFKVEFALNTDFEFNKVGLDELKNSAELYEKGLISFTEFREVARRAKLATEDDEKVLSEVKERFNQQQTVKGATNDS